MSTQYSPARIFMYEKIRNVAIIAHVDHGKTTLIDGLLKQSRAVSSQCLEQKRIMDSNTLEQERGITIFSKECAIEWQGYRINLVDTPGHADFGGEVERILSMVDGVLLLVDAVEGPMPQTRFVTQKAFARGLQPVVVINKIDRPHARPYWVLDQVFDLFVQLGATEEQLDFHTIYASGIQGTATTSLEEEASNLDPLFDTLISCVPAPDVDLEAPFSCQISTLDYCSYKGLIGIGRVHAGCLKRNDMVNLVNHEGRNSRHRLGQLMRFEGLERVETEEVEAGEIVAIAGISDLGISDTLTQTNPPVALPALSIDEPTVSMIFRINDSPFSGKEGTYVTGRQIYDRLCKETTFNVAIRVEATEDGNAFRVSGRGELQLGILVETMRREGFELTIARPQVILQKTDEGWEEPVEELFVDTEQIYQGQVMSLLTTKGGTLQDMKPLPGDRLQLVFHIPSRGLIGIRQQFLTATGGTGIMYHAYHHHAPQSSMKSVDRPHGSLVASCAGESVAYALYQIQARGRLLIGPQVQVYEGMVVGMNSRPKDLVVNVSKAKQLTNVRASGSDENVILTPPVKMTLEQAMSYITDDEWVEVTPESIRIRKQHLGEADRRRASRSSDLG